MVRTAVLLILGQHGHVPRRNRLWRLHRTIVSMCHFFSLNRCYCSVCCCHPWKRPSVTLSLHPFSHIHLESQSSVKCRKRWQWELEQGGQLKDWEFSKYVSKYWLSHSFIAHDSHCKCRNPLSLSFLFLFHSLQPLSSDFWVWFAIAFVWSSPGYCV